MTWWISDAASMWVRTTRQPKRCKPSHGFLTFSCNNVFPSDDSEVTNPKKYRNAGLRKDWNVKLARPNTAKSVLSPLPGFELGGLNDDDIKEYPPVQAVGRVAVGRVAGGSRVLQAEDVVFGFNQVCFLPPFKYVTC